MRKRTVLLGGNVAPPERPGGVERSLEEIARGLRAQGHHPFVLGQPGDQTPAGSDLVEVRVRWARGPWVLLNPFRLRRALMDAIRSVCDEVDEIWARDATVAAAAIRSGVDARVVYIPPGLARATQEWDRGWRGEGAMGRLRDLVWRAYFEPLERRREERAVKGSQAVICFSRNMALALEEEYGRDGVAGVRVVPPGVNLERFRPDLPELDPAVEAELPPRPRAVYLGRLEERKGPGILLEALERMPSLSLIFLGHGRDSQAVASLVRKLGLEDRVALRGWVPDPERYLANSDFLALPSRDESFGHIMLEALACGLPVVGFSRASGARTAVEEVIRDGETGILVHELEPGALARGLRRGMELVSGTPDLPERCRRVVEEGYRWERFVSRVLELGAAPE